MEEVHFCLTCSLIPESGFSPLLFTCTPLEEVLAIVHGKYSWDLHFSSDISSIVSKSKAVWQHYTLLRQEQKCTEGLSDVCRGHLGNGGVKGEIWGSGETDDSCLFTFCRQPPGPKIMGHLIPDVTPGLMHHSYVLKPVRHRDVSVGMLQKTFVKKTERTVNDKDRLITNITHTVPFLTSQLLSFWPRHCCFGIVLFLWAVDLLKAVNFIRCWQLLQDIMFDAINVFMLMIRKSGIVSTTKIPNIKSNAILLK